MLTCVITTQKSKKLNNSSSTQTEFEFLIIKNKKLICSRLDFFLNESSGCIAAIQLFNPELKKITHTFGFKHPEKTSEKRSIFLDELTFIEKVTVVSSLKSIISIEFDLKKEFKLVTLKFGNGKDNYSREEIAPLVNQKVCGFFGSFNSNEQLNTFGLIFESIVFFLKIYSRLVHYFFRT